MRILFFAHLRQVTGQDASELFVSQSVTTEQFWQLLGARYPQLLPFKTSVRLAKNCEYASPDARFSNFDEVALIPPVSGG